MPVGSRLAVRELGAGPHELVLRCEGAGEQRFSEASLESLARAIGRLAPPFHIHRRADEPEAFYVDAAELAVIRHSQGLAVEYIPERAPPDKAARNAATRGAHERALARGIRLHGYPVVVRRAATVAWLRSTPGTEWPPIRITLRQDGSPILTDGNHRVSVARELGLAAIPAQIRTIDGVVEWVVAA